MKPLDRLAAILADPPQIHAGAPHGVWRSGTGCYRFMAGVCESGSVTLETGCGVSTALLTALGARHTCVVADAGEAETLAAYLDERSIDRSGLAFAIGSSDEVLPALRPGDLDLVFIDGCHGYPLPVLDFFYGARWLRRGGILVVDDANLPPVGDYLASFLHRDPRWSQVAGASSWAAYRRDGEGSLVQEWTEQGFLGPKR